MTFEEMQQIIQGMLVVQQELQASQIEFKASLIELRDDIASLNELSRRHERRLEQLIGYSLTGESDRLDLAERLQRLERRVSRLERDENGNQG